MFVQIIQGQVADASAMREAFDRWRTDLAPGSVGWLGSTTGITEDGVFFTAACFESAHQARLNSERPEQHRWWMETAKHFHGDVSFHDCEQVEIYPEGRSAFPEGAGFVQVVQGRLRDPDQVRALMRELDRETGQWRPDVLGAMLALYLAENSYSQIVYFTSEQEARRDATREVSPRAEELMGRLRDLEVGEPTLLDLPDPWVLRP